MSSLLIGGVSIAGNLNIQNTTSVPPPSSPEGTGGVNYVCADTIGNGIQIQNNGWQVTGNLVMNNNMAAATVSRNIVIGNLQCQRNATSVLPSGSGNKVGGTDQCPGM